MSASRTRASALARAGWLLNLGRCVTPDRLYAALYDTCGLPHPSQPGNSADRHHDFTPRYTIQFTHKKVAELGAITLELHHGSVDDYVVVMHTLQNGTIQLRALKPGESSPLLWANEFFIWVP